MPSVSPIEILVVGVIALIVFGPEKLPQIARTVGRAATEVRRVAADVRSEFEAGLDEEPDADEPDEDESTVRPGAGSRSPDSKTASGQPDERPPDER